MVRTEALGLKPELRLGREVKVELELGPMIVLGSKVYVELEVKLILVKDCGVAVEAAVEVPGAMGQAPPTGASPDMLYHCKQRQSVSNCEQ